MSRIPLMDWQQADIGESFSLFKQTLQLFCEDEEITDKAKIALKIKRGLGNEGLRRLNASGLSERDLKDPDKIWTYFEKQLKLQVNFRVYRLELMQFRQKEEENIDEFVTRCKTLALKCEFDEPELQERILELLIASTPFEALQHDLLKQPKGYSLSNALEEGRRYEAISAGHRQVKDLNPTPATTAEVNAINHKYRACQNCGLKHKPKSCPAYQDTCNACHWSKFCRKTKWKTYRQGRHRSKSRHRQKPAKTFNSVDSNHGNNDPVTTDDEDYSVLYHAVTISNQCMDAIDTRRDSAYTDLKVKVPMIKGIHSLRLKVDTGAAGNTLPVRTFRQMYGDRPYADILQPADGTKLVAYNGLEIMCVGTMSIKCKFRDSSFENTLFYVVDVPGPVIVGLSSCESLNIVTINCDEFKPETVSPINSVEDLKQKYLQQFDTIGNFHTSAKLTLKPDAEPFCDPPRKCSIHLKDKIRAEIDRMESIGVIKRVTEHTDWCSSLTYVTKKNVSLRICLDPFHLNQALKRCPTKIPTLEELNPEFAKAKFFSKLDAKAGYWSIHLDEKCQLLTTYRTPFGRYCFRRLPFGLSVSQDIFQQQMNEILEDLTGVVGITNDVCVCGESEQQHDSNLIKLMTRAKEKGLVFNSEKCLIKQKSIPFFGNLYTDKGIRPDPAKISDIQKMPSPVNKEELQKFLGMLTYLSSYIPNYSSESKVLRDLLKKDAIYVWEPIHEQCFDRLKTLVNEDSCLAYYDMDKPLTLEVDASMKGLGAALLQEKPIAFASKSLTPTQSAYSNIEREALSLVHGIQRFHTYLYGRHFHVITDHKPLVMLHQKPINQAPPRLQRMFLKLTGYNFDLSYRPGKDMTLADTLSRLPNPENTAEIQLDTRVDGISLYDVDDCSMDLINFGTSKQEHLKKATCADTTLNLRKEMVHTGWPENIKSVMQVLRPYWSFRDQLAVEDGIIFKGRQVLIPESLQEDILTQLHASHQGVEKTRKLARESVYWPLINKDIEKLIKSCASCQELMPQSKAEPLEPHEIPSAPWRKIGTDLFQIRDKHFLVVTDYFSKYPIIKQIPHPVSSQAVTNELKIMCSILGKPDTVISDNGTQYSGHPFKQFCLNWGITHVTSSPHYPRSNGLAERMVGTVKPIVKKCLMNGQDFDKALLHLRATPIATGLPSPGEMLFGRPLTTTLPSRQETSVRAAEQRERLRETQSSMKNHRDRTSLHRELPPLLPGQSIRFHNQETRTWIPGTIVKVDQYNPRSYFISTAAGSVLRRNGSQLRETATTQSSQTTAATNQRNLPIKLSTPQPDNNNNKSITTTPKKKVTFATKPVTKLISTPSPQHSSDQPQPEQQLKKSRSGRVIKTPQKLKD